VRYINFCGSEAYALGAIMVEAKPLAEEVAAGKEAKKGYELVKLGIKGLDEKIKGVLKSRSYLVSGETGTGKTLFSLGFLLHGALHGEPGIYVLVDEEYDDFVKGAYDFGWDLEYLIDNDMLSIMTILPDFIDRVKNKPVDTIVMSIVESIVEEARRIGAKRLVIDPVAPLVVNENDVAWMREYIRSLVINIEKRVGTTNIITSEIPTGSTKLSRFGVEEFLAAGVFILGLERVKDRFYRTLFVRKMRWRPVHPEIYVFKIVQGQGIVVGKTLSEVVRERSGGKE